MRRGSFWIASGVVLSSLLTGCSGESEGDEVVLRISNWEEYIDLGDWDEEELIELEDGTEIIGENSLIEDFEEWYYETYGVKVRVEYSTFGTNEELYNQITIGDTYDLVCPSEYMIMKMLNEGMLLEFSEDFKDVENEENYYVRGLSPYIAQRFNDINIDGKALRDYAAGYMWGTLGIVYNPEEISDEEASSWKLLLNTSYRKRMTIKDSVRDAYFAAIAIHYYDQITDEQFLALPDYKEQLSAMLNRTDVDTVAGVEEILSDIKDNMYAFETDSGKADMVTGKVIANQQWSGDAVYTMDQADEDGVELCYAMPEEGSNLWFDGWVMLKKGIEEDPRKQQAAEAFANFCARPDNAIRNMYYIGYTSVISGGDDDRIFQYVDWSYSAEEDEEDVVDYEIGYFFTPDEEEYSEYTITCSEDQTRRQLHAQYPLYEEVEKSVIMYFFPAQENERINRMWTNVRCFDLLEFLKIK
ncbi:MAG: extracellular solute-binding protein [Lachnospiraceae bacterium]|nr:extracellular solute-binding protein [Lachnospiraceae bacterium]